VKGNRTVSVGRGGFEGKARNADLGRLLAVLACMGVLLSLPATASAEEETHLFNAALSLTGGCSPPATIDPVQDPGCPGGAHPAKPFTRHGAVAVDLFGNRYVVSGGALSDGSEGRVDVFDSSGAFVTEIAVQLPASNNPPRASVAVDSQGYLYVSRDVLFGESQNQRILRFAPTKYNPAAAEIEYGAAPVAVPNPSVNEGGWGESYLPLAINPANDHLFVGGGNSVTELSSAVEGNGLVGARTGFNQLANAIALDSVRKRLYVSDWSTLPSSGSGKPVVKVFDLEAPYVPEAPLEAPLFTIDGSSTPTGRFVSETWSLPLAVDEASGHLFVGDLEAPTRRVYEFDADGNLVSTIVPEGGFKATGTQLLELAYDDSPTSATEGYLFVPSHNGPGRSLAFEPKPDFAAPTVEALSVSGVTDGEAILRGAVNPHVLQTSYRIEYTSEEAFEARGFEGAAVAGEGTLQPSGEALQVSAPVTGLSPGTAYRFRVVAENELGEAEADAAFVTYGTPQIANDCPNQALSIGPSAALPDCRAYELVTPADTNGHPPYAQYNDGSRFPSRLSSPAGDRLSFHAEGGGIPDIGGTGSFLGDPYLATRGAGSWEAEFTGPSAAFSPSIVPGGSAPDQTHSFWISNGPGPAYLDGEETTYIRYPDGRSEPVGQGSLATDAGANVRLIAEDASHLIFVAKSRQLEPNAPPDGTETIYDRTADGTLHVVSLLPGEITPGPGENALFKGASLDGEGVAFTIGGSLYLRHRNEATYAVGENLGFAGIAAGGGRLFYMKEGDLEAFDAATETVISFSESGDVTPVNVAANGTAAYFASPSVLTGEPNPAGDTAEPGERNLYLSREGQIDFVATLSQRDVEGVPGGTVAFARGLGLWLAALGNPTWGALAIDPSRSTPDGDALLFESNAPLTDYDTDGHTQVYRYDALAGSLACLSCNPTGAPPAGEGALQSNEIGEALLTYWNPVNNLSTDGRRAFFESTEQLVVGDTDGLRDVYEWEGQRVGGCEKPGGCVYLISSGQSGRADYLYAVSDSGNDVFFRTADLLVGADQDETPSIYDARVNGGFPVPPPPAGECLGEACLPAAVAAEDPTPASHAFRGVGNVPAGKPRCRKGTRAVRRRGKVRCVPRRKQHRRANANRRTHR